MKAHTYKGISIEPCEWAGNPHGGRWAIRTQHPTGMDWADQECAHVHTLAEAKERIDESLSEMLGYVSRVSGREVY